MKPTAFIDADIFLRHLLQDDPSQSPKASAFLRTVEAGTVVVATSDTVVFETVFLLERRYKKPKDQIRSTLLPVLALPGIVLSSKRGFGRVFDLYVDLNLPFADAHHAVMMERMGLKQIVSFDEDFDKVPGIARIRL